VIPNKINDKKSNDSPRRDKFLHKYHQNTPIIDKSKIKDGYSNYYINELDKSII